MEYHTGKLPKKDQPFIYIHITPGLDPQDREIIYISNYDKKSHKKILQQHGWFSFSKKDLKDIFDMNLPIIYLP